VKLVFLLTKKYFDRFYDTTRQFGIQPMCNSVLVPRFFLLNYTFSVYVFVCVIVMKYYFCVTDGLKSFLLSILSLVKLAHSRAPNIFPYYLYRQKGNILWRRKASPITPPFCFVFHSYTLQSIYE